MALIAQSLAPRGTPEGLGSTSWVVVIISCGCPLSDIEGITIVRVSFFVLKLSLEPGMVAHARDPATPEIKAGKFKARLGYVDRPCLRKQNKNSPIKKD